MRVFALAIACANRGRVAPQYPLGRGALRIRGIATANAGKPCRAHRKISITASWLSYPKECHRLPFADLASLAVDRQDAPARQLAPTASSGPPELRAKHLVGI